MTTVFVSHASADSALTKQLTGWLKDNGFTDLFVDYETIRTGDRWTDALRNANSSCRIVLCVVTPAWLASDECYAEFLSGWYAGKRIMPLLAVPGDVLDERQQRRMARLLKEDQGFDLTAIGAPDALAFDAHPHVTNTLVFGLKAGGALARIGLDPHGFAVDTARRPDPFPGLESFGDEDADAAIFFGRSAEIATLLEDLREMRASGDRRAYTIVGASGSGKSSLMKAGLLPRLRRERGWLVLRSFRPGADPLYGFAEAIARTAGAFQLTWAPGSIHEEFLTAWRSARGALAQPRSAEKAVPSQGADVDDALDRALVSAVERRIDVLRERAHRSESTCVIAIDQAEELAQNQEEGAVAFGEFLMALSAVPVTEGGSIPYTVVLTVRDDGFSELRASSKFSRLLMRAADVRSLPLYRFANAIEQPAERYGVVMDPALVQAMIEDAPDKDALPLLAFALRRLWTRFAQERRILRSNYELLGKLPGLIEDAAERALRGMSPHDDSPLAPARVPADRDRRVMRLFLPALAQLNERGAPVRRLAPLAVFSDEDRQLLEPFTQWRLLTIRASTIEVSHEAMFREWPRFVDWLAPERERLEALRATEAAAETWNSQGRKPEYLMHRRHRLSAAEALWKVSDYQRQMAAIGPIKDYLVACRRAERRRWASVAAIALLLAGAGSALVATNMRVVDSIVETAANIPAALPGAAVATNRIRDEFALRRGLLQSVLQRYMAYALEGVVPDADSVGTAARQLIQSRASATRTDPWSMGQAAAALGKGVLPQDQLQTYFDAMFIPECACWSPIEGDQHLGATAWIVLGQMTQGVRVRNEVLTALLQRQSQDGGWPVFFAAERTAQSNSTWSTALLVLVLHELSVHYTLDEALATGVHDAIDRGRQWLHARVPPAGQYWVDYPDSAGRKVRSRGNSAFIIYVLLKTGDTPADRKLFRDWFGQLDQPTAFDEMDTSDQFVTLANGKILRDGTRYLTLNWELAALGKGAQQLDAFDRVRARRFFSDALQTWTRKQTGTFDFLTSETLFAINTLYDDGAALQ